MGLRLEARRRFLEPTPNFRLVILLAQPPGSEIEMVDPFDSEDLSSLVSYLMVECVVTEPSVRKSK
jgi:hypothetical protein